MLLHLKKQCLLLTPSLLLELTLGGQLVKAQCESSMVSDIAWSHGGHLLHLNQCENNIPADLEIR